MSFRNLLEGDCGGQNPLVKIGNHFTQDQAYRQERVHPLSQEFSQTDLVSFKVLHLLLSFFYIIFSLFFHFQLVHEFFEDRLGQNAQSFSMDELYREIRDIESASRYLW